MEEGIFRGLFVKLAEIKQSYVSAIIFSAVLFGFWHITASVRDFIDGDSDLFTNIMNFLTLIVASGLMAIKWSFLTKLTGSLWTAMADHFVNNFIINILHVSSSSGVDEMQVVRIAIAQGLSFLVVIVYYFKTRPHKETTFLS